MPRLSFTNRNVCPPDGFRYVFPEDGYAAVAWTWNDVVQLARNHCHANNYSEEGIEDKIEEQICLTLPPEWCNYMMADMPRVSVSLGWSDIVNGVETFARWIKQGRKYVSQEESDRRALICGRCYLNVPISGCLGCQAIVAEATKNLTSKYDPVLKGCAACKCLLKAKIHFPLNVLDKELPGVQEKYPEHCWLKKGGINYHG